MQKLFKPNFFKASLLFLIPIFCGIFLFLGASGARASELTPTIHSTASGGTWSNPIAWVESRAPNEADVVEINGLVSLNINTKVAGLLISSSGTLRSSNNYILTISGGVINNGAIKRDSYPLYLEVTGSIINNGNFNNDWVKLISTQTREVSGSVPITSPIILGASFEITNSPIFLGQVNFNNQAITLNSAEQTITILKGPSASPKILGPGSLIFGSGVSISGLAEAGKIIFGTGSQTIEGIINASQVIFKGAGTKSFNKSTTINSQIIVEPNVLLQSKPYYSYLLTIDGTIENNGTIDYALNTDVSSDIINNGDWKSYQTTLSGNNPRVISGAKPLAGYYIILAGDFEIKNDAVLHGYVNFNNRTLTINEPATVTITSPYGAGKIEGSGILNLKGQVYAKLSTNLSEIRLANGTSLMNYADISADKVICETGNQYFYKATIIASKIIFKGPGIKMFPVDTAINGSVIIEEAAELQNDYYGYFYPTVFNGDVINSGTIKNHSYATFNLYISGNIINKGSWINGGTYVYWPNVPGASNYEFNITDNLSAWPNPVILAGNAYAVTNLLTSTRYWRTRANVNGNWTEWSEIKSINKPEIDPLILKYEPILYLHPDETYQPMNVEAYARHCSLWDSHGAAPDELLKAESSLDPVILDDLNFKEVDSSNYYLQFSENLVDKIPDADKAKIEYQQMIDDGEVKYAYYARKMVDSVEEIGEEYVVLQYWFFYAMSDFGAHVESGNVHEGDWEVVMVFLNKETEQPKYIAHSVHYNRGEKGFPGFQYTSIRNDWDSSELIKDGFHILSLVGLGSHANYPNNGDSGTHDLPVFSDDLTSLEGLRINQEVWQDRFVFEEGNFPGWLVNYRGSWGVYNGEAGKSGAEAPYYGLYNKFNEPIKWAGIDKIGKLEVVIEGQYAFDFAKQVTKMIFDRAVDVGTVFLVDLHDELIQTGNNIKEIVFLPHFWDIESSLENETFNTEVTFNYDSEEISLLGLKEEFLSIFGFDKIQKLWQKIPSAIDLENNTVSFNTTHFSRYAIGIERWQEITGDLKAVKEEEHYDKESKIKTIEIKLKNETKNNISNDLRLMVKDISEPEVVWLNYTGATSEGDLYLDIGQPFEQCVFTGNEVDIPAEVSDSDKEKLLKGKPIEKNECDKMIKKYPQIEDMIDMVLAPERFTESIQLQFNAPSKNFDFEVRALNKVAE